MKRDTAYQLMAAAMAVPITGIIASSLYVNGDLGGYPEDRKQQVDACVAAAERDYYAAAQVGQPRPGFRADPGFLGFGDSPADDARAACEFEVAP